MLQISALHLRKPKKIDKLNYSELWPKMFCSIVLHSVDVDSLFTGTRQLTGMVCLDCGKQDLPVDMIRCGVFSDIAEEICIS